MMWLNHQNLHQILKFPHQVRNIPETILAMGLFNKILLVVGENKKEMMNVKIAQLVKKSKEGSGP